MSRNYSVPVYEIIKEYMEANNISQVELSKKADISTKHICNLLSGKILLTIEMALKLEKTIPGLSADFLMKIENNNRIFEAREEEMKKLLSGNLKELSKQFNFNVVFKNMEWSLEKQAIEMLKLLNISDFNNFDAVYNNSNIRFLEDGGEKESIVTWLKICEKQIDIFNENLSNIIFSKDLVKNSIKNFKFLALSDNIKKSMINLIKLCNSLGLYIVIEDALPNSKVRGATTIHNNKPAIYLSRRFKTHDKFWFAFFHELAHVLLHFDGKDSYISYEDEESIIINELEKEANDFANNTLIDLNEYDTFVNNDDYSAKAIKLFAEKNKILPGILVARLQSEQKLDYSDLSYLKVKIEASDIPTI